MVNDTSYNSSYYIHIKLISFHELRMFVTQEMKLIFVTFCYIVIKPETAADLHQCILNIGATSITRVCFL